MTTIFDTPGTRVTPPPIISEDPLTWVLFIVSNIAGQHRPLAVVERTQSDEFPNYYQNDDIVASVGPILTIVSDPANRVAFDSERALAVDLFHMRRRDTAGTTISKLPKPKTCVHSRDLSQFPFISTCLLLGATKHVLTHLHLDGRPMPLDTMYCDCHPNRAMVVFDVTDLEAPRYGIIPSHEVEYRTSFDPSDPRSHQSQGQHVGNQPRQPLSAMEYLRQCGFDDTGEDARKLEHVPLVDSVAMDLIWQPSGTIESRNLFISPPARPPSRSLHDQVIATLINSTLERESFDMTIFDRPRAILHFQHLLRRMLCEESCRLGQSRATGQLIGLAFAGNLHLDLVQIQGLSAEAIGAALEMEELKSVTSISLCIDALVSTPKQIVDVLARMTGLRDMYFFQEPIRRSDELSTAFFLELCKRPHLFRLGRIFVSGAYSAALYRKFWLPTENDFHPPFDTFPVQHLFFQEQTPGPMFPPIPQYIGDALLRPEAFVAGFLHWILAPDPCFWAFAGGPPTLDDMSRSEVSPIPGEVSAVPTIVPNIMGQDVLIHNSEMRSKTRDLVPGSWSVIAWRAIYVHDEVVAGHQRVRIESMFWKYAFIRPLVHIAIDTVGTGVPVAWVGPDEVEVMGVKEFLKITAPHVDPALVDQRLEEIEVDLAPAAGPIERARLKPGMRRLSLLDHGDAYHLLGTFLLRGRQIRKHLRNAMRARPDLNWYPELLHDEGL